MKQAVAFFVKDTAILIWIRCKSLSPDWNHAFLVPIPLIRPVHGGYVQVSVWDDDYFGSDDFLGQVHLDGSFIVRQRTMAKVVKPLQPRKKGEAVQGTIQLRVFCPPGIMDLCQKNTAYVTSKTQTNNTLPRCHVRLKVLRADGLRKADCFCGPDLFIDLTADDLVCRACPLGGNCTDDMALVVQVR